MSTAPSRPHISVVIPLFNEAESIPELYGQLTDVLSRMGADYELVWIDDGSRDASLSILREQARQDKRVRVISFRRYFG